MILDDPKRLLNEIRIKHFNRRCLLVKSLNIWLVNSFSVSKICNINHWNFLKINFINAVQKAILTKIAKHAEYGVNYRVIMQAPHWLTYDFPSDVREKLNRQWGSDWKGQAQKW